MMNVFPCGGILGRRLAAEDAVLHRPEPRVAVPPGEVLAVEETLHSGRLGGSGPRLVSGKSVDGKQACDQGQSADHGSLQSMKAVSARRLWIDDPAISSNPTRKRGNAAAMPVDAAFPRSRFGLILGPRTYPRLAGLNLSPTARRDYIHTLPRCAERHCLGNSSLGLWKQNKTDCRIGVHGHYPGGCGFESHRRNFTVAP